MPSPCLTLRDGYFTDSRTAASQASRLLLKTPVQPGECAWIREQSKGEGLHEERGKARVSKPGEWGWGKGAVGGLAQW